jgi:hypothetical protein
MLESTEMDEKTDKPQDSPDLASFETDLFGAFFGFHRKAMDLLRNSGLDDGKMKLVADRISQLLDDATAEMKRTKNLDLSGPLESAYEEVKRMVEELSEQGEATQ